MPSVSFPRSAGTPFICKSSFTDGNTVPQEDGPWKKTSFQPKLAERVCGRLPTSPDLRLPLMHPLTQKRASFRELFPESYALRCSLGVGAKFRNDLHGHSCVGEASIVEQVLHGHVTCQMAEERDAIFSTRLCIGVPQR